MEKTRNICVAENAIIWQKTLRKGDNVFIEVAILCPQ